MRPWLRDGPRVELLSVEEMGHLCLTVELARESVGRMVAITAPVNAAEKATTQTGTSRSVSLALDPVIHFLIIALSA